MILNFGGTEVMISFRDSEYIETKLIKQGKKSLHYPFKDLAEWISREYFVNVHVCKDVRR